MASRIRRAGAAALALIMLGMTPAYALNNNAQIENVGGTAGTLAQDGVEVSKTIAPTGIENYFDITLTAKTQTLYNGTDAAAAHVVIVLDLSNTMNYDFGEEKIPNDETKSRYYNAIQAVNKFIDGFVGITSEDSNADRMIGVAAFNTDGHVIKEMSRAILASEGTAIKNEVASKTNLIIKATDYKSSHSRFTNMEAGLKVAYDMLVGSRNGKTIENEMIIFVTDGYPTTYLNNATSNLYDGYDPYMVDRASGSYGTDGVFRDESNKAKSTAMTYNTNTGGSRSTTGVYCLYGTDYSDKAAQRATTMAASIRAAGIQIYSVGVAVTGETITKYETKNYSTYKRENGDVWTYGNVGNGGFSTIDTNCNNTESGNYYIKNLPNWLKGIDANGGIGSNSYVAADNADTLISALKDMVGETDAPVGVGTTAQSTLDPVYSGGTGDFVEFVGFFEKKDGTALQTSLAGKSAKWGEAGAENTASFTQGSTASDDKISWDLTKSAYDETVAYNDGGSAENWTTKTVTRTYTLKYRVRLKNEAAGFIASTQYATNGETTLNYTKTNENGTTESKTIDYPIPQVKGYLGQLSFKKVDADTGAGLSGAEFKLSHHADCTQCKGNGAPKAYEGVTIANMTATSAADGTVTFSSIPSGHSYVLSETTAPGMHHTLGETYTVSVEYGTATISKKDTDTHITISPENGTVITNDSVMPGDVTIPFEKLLDGNPAPDGLFEFVLVDEEGNELQRVSPVGGEGQFVVNYKGAMDTRYTYTIHEVNKGGRYNYDNTVYTVVVTLNEGEGNNYTASVAYYKGELTGSDDQLTEPVLIEGVPVFNNSTRSSSSSSSSSTHTTPVPIIVNKPPKSGGMSGLGLVIGLMAAAAVVARGRRSR